MTPEHKAACLHLVCIRGLAGNAAAWFDLHKSGLTRELLREVSDGPGWIGAKPCFDLAPAYDSAIWKFLEAQDAVFAANEERNRREALDPAQP